MTVATIDMEAEELGLGVSDKYVAQSVVNDPNLRDLMGNFDHQRFNTMLQRLEMTENMYIAERRATILRQQLVEATQKGAVAPTTLTNAIFKYQDELRSAAYVVLPKSLGGDIKDPDAKTLEAYYKSQAARFTDPETRTSRLSR